jgi:TnpA family transposase
LCLYEVYIDDENRRRATLLQLNRGEGRHSLARDVFHGKRGELRQRYREGQEDQLGALGLVVNIIVLWNTIYIDAALAQLGRKATRYGRRMSRGCRPSFTSGTSICWDAIPS